MNCVICELQSSLGIHGGLVPRPRPPQIPKSANAQIPYIKWYILFACSLHIYTLNHFHISYSLQYNANIIQIVIILHCLGNNDKENSIQTQFFFKNFQSVVEPKDVEKRGNCVSQ